MFGRKKMQKNSLVNNNYKLWSNRVRAGASIHKWLGVGLFWAAQLKQDSDNQA